MSEIDAEVVRRLVTGRKNDGRAVYDPQAKAEVVRACLKPGVSVARMALQCGINANLLRRWITQSMGADMKVRIPAKVDTDSGASWTVIPREGGQRFQSKLDSRHVATREGWFLLRRGCRRQAINGVGTLRFAQ